MNVPADELYRLLQILKQVSGPGAAEERERCIRAKADRKFLEAMRIHPDFQAQEDVGC